MQKLPITTEHDGQKSSARIVFTHESREISKSYVDNGDDADQQPLKESRTQTYQVSKSVELKRDKSADVDTREYAEEQIVGNTERKRKLIKSYDGTSNGLNTTFCSHRSTCQVTLLQETGVALAN